LKNAQEHIIFENSFFPREKGGVKVVYSNYDLVNGFGWFT